jgi:hypothetical protein
MQKRKVVVEEAAAALAIKPEMLEQLKNEDMQQAVVEKFRATKPTTARVSPHWQIAQRGMLVSR